VRIATVTPAFASALGIFHSPDLAKRCVAFDMPVLEMTSRPFLFRIADVHAVAIASNGRRRPVTVALSCPRLFRRPPNDFGRKLSAARTACRSRASWQLPRVPLTR
jgi:hypothetical protein